MRLIPSDSHAFRWSTTNPNSFYFFTRKESLSFRESFCSQSINMFPKCPPIWKSVIFWLPIPIALCRVFLTCDVFLILILVFVSRVLVRALWHFRYPKNPILEKFTFLFLYFFFFFIFFKNIALCDGDDNGENNTSICQRIYNWIFRNSTPTENPQPPLTAPQPPQMTRGQLERKDTPRPSGSQGPAPSSKEDGSSEKVLKDPENEGPRASSHPESDHSTVSDFSGDYRSSCDAAEPWQLGSQDAATPMMQGIIDLHHDIFFFLILILVFVSRILVRALWHFHYPKNPIPQRIVHGTTIEILRTIFLLLFLVLMLIGNDLEVAHCAGSWEASSANHNVPPGGEGTSGGNSGWTSILGSSSGESSEASVNQPTGSSNQDRAGPSSAIPGQNVNPIEQPAPQHTPFPLLQEQGERGDLLRSLHRLIASQLKHSFERNLPRWRISSTTELYDAPAYYILTHDMELGSPQDTKENIQEWIDNVRSNPDLLKDSYNFFKEKPI